MEEKKTCPCCEERHKERSDKEYKDLIHRLNRMEGQIRGIRGMVERGVYCTDILVQVAAVNAALATGDEATIYATVAQYSGAGQTPSEAPAEAPADSSAEAAAILGTVDESQITGNTTAEGQ